MFNFWLIKYQTLVKCVFICYCWGNHPFYLFIYFFVDAEFTIKPSICGYLKSIVEKSLFAHCSMNTFILAYNYITLSIQSNASKWTVYVQLLFSGSTHWKKKKRILFCIHLYSMYILYDFSTMCLVTLVQKKRTDFPKPLHSWGVFVFLSKAFKIYQQLLFTVECWGIKKVCWVSWTHFTFITMNEN